METKEAQASWQAWHDRALPRARDSGEFVTAQFDEECRRHAEEFRKRTEQKPARWELELQKIKVTHGRPV